MACGRGRDRSPAARRGEMRRRTFSLPDQSAPQRIERGVLSKDSPPPRVRSRARPAPIPQFTPRFDGYNVNLTHPAFLLKV